MRSEEAGMNCRILPLFRSLLKLRSLDPGCHLRIPVKLTVGSNRDGDENVALRPSAGPDFPLAFRHTMISPQQASLTEVRGDAT